MQPSIGILLRELARLYTQAQREHVTSGHDTSSTQSHVLMELGRAGLLTQHELGRRLSLDKGWVSRAVESLVQSGLVAKSRHENDRRSRWLQLTSKGSTRYQALNVSLDAHAELLMQPLAPEQRTSIYQALILLLNGLQSALPQEALQADEVTLHSATADISSATTLKLPVNEPLQAVEALTEIEPSPLQASEAVAAQPVLATSTMAVASEEQVASSEPTSSAVAEEIRIKAPVVPRTPVTPRPGQPGAPTRILGSKTLPSRPLLSRTTPRTPLSRAAHLAEQKSVAPLAEAPAVSVRPTVLVTPPTAPMRVQSSPAPMVARSSLGHPTQSAPAHNALSSAQGGMHAASRMPAPPIRVTPVAPPVPQAVASTDTRPSGSLFSKLLSSQGSIFNKLLQRDQTHPEHPQEEQPVVEAEPNDNIQFQQAFPTDWNEIRNLLTANRQTVQGALNHLSHFVVATENGRVVGAIGLEVYGDIGLLRSLVVASNMRGRSIAKRLIKHLVARCKDKQLSALYLLTGTADPLFERFGFIKMPRADMPTKLYVSMELQGPSSTASTGMRLVL